MEIETDRERDLRQAREALKGFIKPEEYWDAQYDPWPGTLERLRSGNMNAPRIVQWSELWKMFTLGRA